MNRGRESVFLLLGALVVVFIAGWLRGPLLFGLRGLVVSLPWLPLRRLTLGLVYDLPTALVMAALCALAGRVLVLKPLPTALYLVGAVWVLDVIAAWLISDDLRLWSDPLVFAARLVIVVATALGSALLLGWRPRRPSEKKEKEEDHEEDDTNEV